MSFITSGQILIKANVSGTITANSNIFSSNLKASTNPFAIFIVYACFADTGNLAVVRNNNLEVLNQANPLTGTGAYIFSFPVFTSDLINMQYSVNTTATKLVVMEDMGPRL